MENEQKYANNATLNKIRKTYLKVEEYNRAIRKEERIIKNNSLAMQSRNLLIEKIQMFSQLFHASHEYQKLCFIISPNNLSSLFCLSENHISLLGQDRVFDTPKDFFDFIVESCSLEIISLDYSLNVYEEIYNAVYEYLKHNPLPPYYVFLQKYASQFGIHNLFYSINNFVFINKNLYITSSNMVTGYNIKIRPINKQLLQSLYFNTAFPSREFFQKFYHQLSLAIKDKPHYTEKDITYYPNSFFLTHDNKVFNVRFSTNKIEVLDKVLPFVFNKNYCFAKQQLTDFNTLLSKQSIQLLHTLSFGSINKLLEIASLWAMISTNTYYALEKSKRVLYIINCSSEVRSILKDFFNNCALKSPLFDGFNSITKKNALAEIIMYPLNNINYIASVSSKRMESPLQKATILKLIQGTTISFQNDIGLPMRLKNKIPIICFSDSQKDIKRISEEYPSEILNIDFDIDTYTNICKELTQEDYTKIATFLSLLGLYYRTSTNILKKDAMTSDTPVDIITSFCQPAEGHYLYFEDIYNIYLQYCKYACINTPLTSIVFNKILKQKYAYKRPRTSRTDNRWAYINVCFDKERFSNYVLSLKQKIHSNTDFTNYIFRFQENINEMLNTAFETFSPSNNSNHTYYIECL